MRYNLWLMRTVMAVGIFVAFQNCRQKPKEESVERFTSDSTKIVVDDSFRPIVDEELYIFRALYNNVHPRITYAPENNAINLLLADSMRVAVLSRDLNAQEYRALETKNIRPVADRFAIDAISLIVNEASNDTLFTTSQIKDMLNGHTKLDKNIVFDNPNSGLVRYLKEFSGNRELKQKNIYALNSSKDVIAYVSQHANAIGIVGFSWLNDPDKDYADKVRKVKIVGVMDDLNKTAPKEYYTPSQNTLALKQYPLTRNLYIINGTGQFGLGMKFVAFLKSDRGQRIILKSGLLPDEIPTREIVIRRKITQ